MAPIILGYWDIRGLAQPIRLLLEESGLEWEDKLYSFGPAPDFNWTSWLQEKETLGLDFPDLPYLLDGEVKLTQSSAIIRYVARKAKMDGETEEEKQRVDLIEAEIADVKAGFKVVCNTSNFADVKDSYMQNLTLKLQRLADFLGKRRYFAGDNLTFVDFIVYEVLDQHTFLSPEYLKVYGNLGEFMERIQNLERISGYMKSPRFIKYPINRKMATFGG